MTELVLAWQWLWLRVAYMRPPRDSDARLEELRGLMQRAVDDIRQDWPEAALDALGRALRLLDQRE